MPNRLPSTNSLMAARLLLAGIVIAAFAAPSFAQLSARQQRLNAVDWFYLKFVHPKKVCALAGPAELARVEAVLADIQKDNVRVFELIEQSKEYIATIAAAKLVDDDYYTRWSRQQAQAECSKLTFLLLRDHKSRRDADQLKYLIDLFSTPT